MPRRDGGKLNRHKRSKRKKIAKVQQARKRKFKRGTDMNGGY